MAIHSIILDWGIRRTEEPGELQSMGLQKEPETAEQLTLLLLSFLLPLPLSLRQGWEWHAILRDTEGKDGNYPSTLPAFLSEFLSMETVGPVHLRIWKLQIQPANCTLFFFFSVKWILFLFFFIIIFYCSRFCHTLKWNSHGFTCVPHPDPPSHLPLYPIPLGLPSAPGPSACLMHPTWAGDLFHSR